jgi:hypothetical protein
MPCAGNSIQGTYKPIKNIVFATNIDEEEVESIKYTVKLSEQLKAYTMNIQNEEPENVKIYEDPKN